MVSLGLGLFELFELAFVGEKRFLSTPTQTSPNRCDGVKNLFLQGSSLDVLARMWDSELLFIPRIRLTTNKVKEGQ